MAVCRGESLPNRCFEIGDLDTRSATRLRFFGLSEMHVASAHMIQSEGFG